MSFQWIAVYQDGLEFPQFDPKTGIERSSEHIDRANLSSFTLYGDDGQPILTQHLDPGQRFIYRRRTHANQGGVVLKVCHLVGWQQTVNGQNVQHIAYVFEPDGRIEMAGRFRENDNRYSWFYGICPVSCEEVEVGSNSPPPQPPLLPQHLQITEEQLTELQKVHEQIVAEEEEKVKEFIRAQVGQQGDERFGPPVTPKLVEGGGDVHPPTSTSIFDGEEPPETNGDVRSPTQNNVTGLQRMREMSVAAMKTEEDERVWEAVNKQAPILLTQCGPYIGDTSGLDKIDFGAETPAPVEESIPKTVEGDGYVAYTIPGCTQIPATMIVQEIIDIDKLPVAMRNNELSEEDFDVLLKAAEKRKGVS